MLFQRYLSVFPPKQFQQKKKKPSIKLSDLKLLHVNFLFSFFQIIKIEYGPLSPNIRPIICFCFSVIFATCKKEIWKRAPKKEGWFLKCSASILFFQFAALLIGRERSRRTRIEGSSDEANHSNNPLSPRASRSVRRNFELNLLQRGIHRASFRNYNPSHWIVLIPRAHLSKHKRHTGIQIYWEKKTKQEPTRKWKEENSPSGWLTRMLVFLFCVSNARKNVISHGVAFYWILVGSKANPSRLEGKHSVIRCSFHGCFASSFSRPTKPRDSDALNETAIQNPQNPYEKKNKDRELRRDRKTKELQRGKHARKNSTLPTKEKGKFSKSGWIERMIGDGWTNGRWWTNTIHRPFSKFCFFSCYVFFFNYFSFLFTSALLRSCPLKVLLNTREKNSIKNLFSFFVLCVCNVCVTRKSTAHRFPFRSRLSQTWLNLDYSSIGTHPKPAALPF